MLWSDLLILLKQWVSFCWDIDLFVAWAKYLILTLNLISNLNSTPQFKFLRHKHFTCKLKKLKLYMYEDSTFVIYFKTNRSKELFKVVKYCEDSWNACITISFLNIVWWLFDMFPGGYVWSQLTLDPLLVRVLVEYSAR